MSSFAAMVEIAHRRISELTVLCYHSPALKKWQVRGPGEFERKVDSGTD
jgi:hypothetical protein